MDPLMFQFQQVKTIRYCDLHLMVAIDFLCQHSRNQPQHNHSCILPSCPVSMKRQISESNWPILWPHMPALINPIWEVVKVNPSSNGPGIIIKLTFFKMYLKKSKDMSLCTLRANMTKNSEESVLNGWWEIPNPYGVRWPKNEGRIFLLVSGEYLSTKLLIFIHKKMCVQ